MNPNSTCKCDVGRVSTRHRPPSLSGGVADRQERDEGGRGRERGRGGEGGRGGGGEKEEVSGRELQYLSAVRKKLEAAA